MNAQTEQNSTHTPDRAELERALVEAKANEIYSSQLMRRFRDTLSNVRDGLEDEGDRIYFGSTNDADQLRDIIEEIEELEWDRILASSQKKPDLYARIRELNTEVRALRILRDDMLAVLKDFVSETRAYSSPECEECEIVGPLLRAADVAIAKAKAVQS